MKTVPQEALLAGGLAGDPVADGKSKTLWPTALPEVCLMEFKPHARSITSAREENLPGTDYWRLLAALDILLHLESKGIPTHLRHDRALARGGRFFLAVARCRPLPVEWICRYEAAGSIVRLFPTLVKPGQRFAAPLFKYDYKQDVRVAGVDDPTLNESYLVGLGLCTASQLSAAQHLLAAIGERVKEYLGRAGMRLIDMKMEFGHDPDGQLVLIDEISQDCIRAVDDRTGLSLTKDVFRQLQSGEEVVRAYQEFARRLNPTVEERMAPELMARLETLPLEEVFRLLYGAYCYLARTEESVSSSTRDLLRRIGTGDTAAILHCFKKLLEEHDEVRRTLAGRHVHEGQPLRATLVNELQQFLYWAILPVAARGIALQDTRALAFLDAGWRLPDVSKHEFDAGGLDEVAILRQTMADVGLFLTDFNRNQQGAGRMELREVLLADLRQMALKNYLLPYFQAELPRREQGS